MCMRITVCSRTFEIVVVVVPVAVTREGSHKLGKIMIRYEWHFFSKINSFLQIKENRREGWKIPRVDR